MDVATSRPTIVPAERLFRRRVAEFGPLTARSIVLFRLGEICNHHCPMCSNSGREAAWLTPTDELLRRVDWLRDQGARRVVVTGGEPTVHPGFPAVIARLAERTIAWDLNTNGSRLAEPGFCTTAADHGLLRAIVSLHAHDPAIGAAISGTTAKGHGLVVAGIDALLACGVAVMINCVATRPMVGRLAELVRWGVARFGPVPVWKLVFPSTAGKGGGWVGIDLRYGEVADDLLACRAIADEAGVEVVFESVPPCVLGDASIRNVARSGFGETHYLDDLSGSRLYRIDHIEAHFQGFVPACRRCRAFRDCPGVAFDYLRRHGAAELRPL